MQCREKQGDINERKQVIRTSKSSGNYELAGRRLLYIQEGRTHGRHLSQSAFRWRRMLSQWLGVSCGPNDYSRFFLVRPISHHQRVPPRLLSKLQGWFMGYRIVWFRYNSMEMSIVRNRMEQADECFIGDWFGFVEPSSCFWLAG